MRKIIVFALLSCLAIGSAAQTYWDGSRPDHRLTVGLRAGGNFSKQYNDGDGADNDFRPGFQGGLEIDLNLFRSLSLNTGAYYVQRGYKTEYSDYRGSKETTDNVAYIEVPVLVSYRVKLSDASEFQLNVGPYFGFGISGKQKTTSTFAGLQDYEIDSFDEYDGMKKSDIGLHIGAAVVYSDICFGIFYERGLTNVSNVPNADYKNGSIGISIGYNFNLF